MSSILGKPCYVESRIFDIMWTLFVVVLTLNAPDNDDKSNLNAIRNMGRNIECKI